VKALPGRLRFDLIFPVAFAIAGTCAAATNGVLATAAEILSLSADDAARGIAVSITGIVTVAESNWKGRFFVQDSTGGVFVNNETEPGPVPGDVVQVSGASHIGGYAPDIIRLHWKKFGTAPLPEPRRISVDRLMGGPARWVAAETAAGKPSWLYYFSYVGSRFPPTKTRAGHADEIQYAWEYWGRRTPMSMVSAKDQEVATLMHACWVSFAKTGVPKCGTGAWPAYTPTGDQLMEFGKESGVRTNFRKAQLDAQQASVRPTLALGK